MPLFNISSSPSILTMSKKSLQASSNSKSKVALALYCVASGFSCHRIPDDDFDFGAIRLYLADGSSHYRLNSFLWLRLAVLGLRLRICKKEVLGLRGMARAGRPAHGPIRRRRAS